MNGMQTAITEGVEIKVETQFRPDLSNIELGSFFYNYHVTVENHNAYSVQLMHRDWYIFDSLDEANLVSGPGVIGEQPTLRPTEKFHYTSGCELTSEAGFMKGFYTFQNLVNGLQFQVEIPVFNLIFPPKLN